MHVDVAARDARRGERAAHGIDRGIPPVLRTLLGPHGPLHPHVFVRRRVARAHAPAAIHQQRARASGSDIDSQPHGRYLT